MFSPMFSILLIPFLAAMFLAINMGASGTAPSFSAAYGANLIRRERIAGVFGICVLAGALIAGRKVAVTVSRGVLPEDLMGITLTTIVLVSVALSLLMANLLRVPQSTSQATIAALVGPAVYYDVLKAHIQDSLPPVQELKCHLSPFVGPPGPEPPGGSEPDAETHRK